MFKLVLLLALCAAATAAPSGALVPIAYAAPHAYIEAQPHALYHQPLVHPAIVHTPLIASVPTSISSHSTTVYHGGKAVVPLINQHKLLTPTAYIAV